MGYIYPFPTQHHSPPSPISISLQCFSNPAEKENQLLARVLNYQFTFFYVNMARQIVVVALVLMATVGLAFGADAPSPSAGAAATTTPKPGLPTFSGVPVSGPVAAADNNQVGTMGGDSGEGAAAPSPSGSASSDGVTAGSVGGPVSESTFGSIDGGNAESPKASAATAEQLSAGAVVAAGVAASLFF
ncbi:anther-specific protein BCP1-like [Prunus persica]|uniref:anther-specific protein BCP1-like n=1 Tax=Prunus persica TaxID=3760 RepID=UPI0009AB37BB|nr:anther-specific protein BCP1-like [Prunus persica]